MCHDYVLLLHGCVLSARSLAFSHTRPFALSLSPSLALSISRSLAGSSVICRGTHIRIDLHPLESVLFTLL